jgi:hypothetical protein
MTLTMAAYKMTVNESETITDAQPFGGAGGRRSKVPAPSRRRDGGPLAAAVRNLERS